MVSSSIAGRRRNPYIPPVVIPAPVISVVEEVKPVIETKEIEPVKKGYSSTCKKCGAVFTDRGAWMSHVRTHRGDK